MFFGDFSQRWVGVQDGVALKAVKLLNRFVSGCFIGFYWHLAQAANYTCQMTRPGEIGTGLRFCHVLVLVEASGPRSLLETIHMSWPQMTENECVQSYRDIHGVCLCQ